MLINVSVIRKMIKKVLIYQLLTNLDAKLKSKDLQLTHKQLSHDTGRHPSWFNSSFNELEDIQISTFFRILAAANERLKARTEKEIDAVFLHDILTLDAIHMANALNKLADEEDGHLLDFIEEEKKVFQDLISYWGILSDNNKLDATEDEILKEIRRILNPDSNAEQEEEDEQ